MCFIYKAIGGKRKLHSSGPIKLDCVRMAGGWRHFLRLYPTFKMEGLNKPPCKFGIKCYRKNPKHFDMFSHPEGSHKQSQIVRPIRNKLPLDDEIPIASTSLKRKKKNPIAEKKIKLGIHDNKGEITKNFECDSDKNASVGKSLTLTESKSSKIKSSAEMDLQNKSVEEIIKVLFLVDMPPDFYSFYEFCKSVEESYQLQIGELKLVGPFDVLSGGMDYSVDQDSLLCHWRYYYDPPEFQTVLTAASGFHIGYWRDDPNENPVFLASNDPNKDCIFKVEAENIFGSVFHYLNEFTKNLDPFKKIKIAKLQTALSNWAKKNRFSLQRKSAKLDERQKKVVSKTFHGAGIVVPVEAETDLGYRPLIETDENLKKICKLIMTASDDTEKEALWDNLQPLITAANIANDECDFGNSLELGIDLFCMGSAVFHETVEHLLSTAYSLLNRAEFEKIIKAHLKYRRRGNNLSVNGSDLNQSF